MMSKTAGVVAFVLGTLLVLPPAGNAEIAGTGTFGIAVHGGLPDVDFDGVITFDNAAHDVGGTSVNLGSSIGTMNYMGTADVNTSTLSASFTVSATDGDPMPFSFAGDGGGACQTACINGSATFAGSLDSPITDPNNVLPNNFTYTFDGTVSINFLGMGAGGTVAINAFPSISTDMGADVMVPSGATTFFDTRADAAKSFDILLVFDNVSSAGGTTTFIGLTAVPGALPVGIVLDSAVSRFVDIVSTAPETGMIDVCFNFPDANTDGIIDGTSIELSRLRVLHQTTPQAAFVDVTTSHTTGQVCGQVGDLSPFVVGLIPTTTTTTIAQTTTTTTSTSTTTTTLPLGNCADGLSCVNTALGTSICGDESIHPKLRATLKMKLKKAKALLTKAASADATKAAKLVAKVQAFLDLLRTKADAFAARTKKPISAECRDSLRAAFDQVDQALTDNPPGS